MPEDSRYVWAMIRLVPDTASGEFVNIGVLVGSDDKDDYVCKLADDLSRAEWFGGVTKLGWALEVVGDFSKTVDSMSDGSFVPYMADGLWADSFEGWLRVLIHDHRNLVQLSEVSPGVFASAQQGACDILDWCVGGIPEN